MKKYYFTFGSAHNHTVNGKFFNMDSVCGIEAEDYGKAREKAFTAFGDKWAFQYDDESLEIKYFPRGVINLEGEANDTH